MTLTLALLWAVGLVKSHQLLIARHRVKLATFARHRLDRRRGRRPARHRRPSMFAFISPS